MTLEAPTLRDRQAAATREQILEVAMHQLGQNPRGTFSHESIAEAAGMGARTVYRHFPDRASLLNALWERLREATQTRFPSTEEEILTLAQTVFREFDANEPGMLLARKFVQGTDAFGGGQRIPVNPRPGNGPHRFASASRARTGSEARSRSLPGA